MEMIINTTDNPITISEEAYNSKYLKNIIDQSEESVIEGIRFVSK